MSSAIGLIQGSHAVIAGLSRQGHWFVNDADAKRYAQAMANAARHFPLKATQKTIDVMMFAIVAGSIEIPRIVMSIQLAKGGQRVGPRGPAQVFQFVSPNASSAPPGPPPVAENAGASAAASPSPQAADAPYDPSSEHGAIGGEPAA